MLEASSRKVGRLLRVARPAVERIDDERVLDVDEDADRRVDPRQRLDGEHGVKERRAGAAVGLGNLDAHDAEVEQLVDELWRNLRVLVHLADERPDFAIGEFVDAVAEEGFVLAEPCEGRNCVYLLHS